MKQRVRAACLIFITLSLLSGCATEDPPGSLARIFFDNVNRYPQTGEKLRVKPLATASLGSLRRDAAPEVYVIVHPGYGLFFRDQRRASYSDAKYRLLTKQFNDEERFIRDASRSGKIVVLIVPGEYEAQMQAPDVYTAYLNSITEGASAIFYVYSESLSNGTISSAEMVELYRFLQGLNVRRVLIGGGYVGRCQREFYSELTAYYEKTPSFIVPEISTLSPEDISDTQAAAMLEGITRNDYALIRKFIEMKLERTPDVLFAPR